MNESNLSSADINQAYLEMVRYETGWKRFWAAIVDMIVFMPFLLISKWMVQSGYDASLFMAWTIFTTLVPIAYSVLLHYKYGQTIGKWVTGIKVIDVSETRLISLRQSLMRESFYLGIELIALFYFLFLVFQVGDINYIIEDYRSFTDLPYFLWLLLELVSMLTNKKRRAVHDFLAKSVVVRV
jgi:uncharacterized RDD family membrane protein YckC